MVGTVRSSTHLPLERGRPPETRQRTGSLRCLVPGLSALLRRLFRRRPILGATTSTPHSSASTSSVDPAADDAEPSPAAAAAAARRAVRAAGRGTSRPEPRE
jgi:hypothetical protein